MSSSRNSFFRQTGWLLIASNIGGVFMWLVHMVARRMEPDQYSMMTTLFQSLLLLFSIGSAVQVVFAREAAAVVDDSSRARVRTVTRHALVTLTVLWVIGAGVVLLMQPMLASQFGIAGPVLWMTILLALPQAWLPVTTGLMQGDQNFLWLGWSAIVNGGVRFVAVLTLVWVLSLQAFGGVSGAFIGVLAAFGVTVWQARGWLTGPGGKSDAVEWFREITPLALGTIATAMVLTADVVFVRRNFSGEESAFYNAAGMIGRALVAFTSPLTAVMFPKVVAAAARSEKSDAMALALGATAFMGTCAAIACTVLPELPIRIVQGVEYLPAAKLIPKLAWCILPFVLANVLVNNLLARRRYVIVPWLLLVAGGYVAALMKFGTSLEAVIYTLGVFGTLLLAVCAWFTWRGAR